MGNHVTLNGGYGVGKIAVWREERRPSERWDLGGTQPRLKCYWAGCNLLAFTSLLSLVVAAASTVPVSGSMTTP